MGTWNVGILDNDNAKDVYDFFEKLYNKQELDIEFIKKKTLKEFELVNENNDSVYSSDEWLAYALICWECQVLDTYTIDAVQKILNDKKSIENEWGALSEKRIKEIEKFLIKIQIPAKRKKAIRKGYIVNIPFREGDCIVFQDDNGIYSGLILLQIIKDRYPDEPNMWTYNWGTTRIFSTLKPAIQDFIDSYFLVVNYGKTIDGKNARWIEEPKILINGMLIGDIKTENVKKEYENLFSKCEIIGNLMIKKIPKFNQSYSAFRFFHKYDQFEWEKKHPESIDLSYPVKQYI